MIKNYSKLLCMAAFTLTLGLGTTTTLSVISAGDAVASGGDTCNISCTGEGEQKASGSCACECMEGYEPNDDTDNLMKAAVGKPKGCKLKKPGCKGCECPVGPNDKPGSGQAINVANEGCKGKDDNNKSCEEVKLTADPGFELNTTPPTKTCPGSTITYKCKDGKAENPPYIDWNPKIPVGDECPEEK